MQVELKIDPEQPQTKVIILTPAMTEEVSALMQQLSDRPPASLTGTKDQMLVMLDMQEIIRILAADGKVYATTGSGDFILRQRLFELEEQLDKRRFVRISHSEIINLKKAKGFDLKRAGTICVRLEGGIVTYVSRRYVGRIKQVLGV